MWGVLPPSLSMGGEGDTLHTVSRDALLAKFRDPSPEYGMINCWWWEAGHLSQEKMRWQLEQLKEKGVSGTWLYPRFVYDEPLHSDPGYWTEKWWDFVRFTMETERELGLRTWFSDWTNPQFFQNRLRQERAVHRELVGHRLVQHEKESKGNELLEFEIPPEEEILHAAAYKMSGDAVDYASLKDLRSVVRNHTIQWHAPEAGWLMTVIASQTNDLNYFNRSVVDRWLQIFLGKYEQRLPEFLGKTLAAYGPDEMYLILGNTLYDRSLIDKIQSERGYDVTPYLIALFHDIGSKTDQIRCDYYGAMASLLEENFYKPFAEWLQKRGMEYVTVATWGREDLLEQTFHYGDFFRYMRHFNVTGNEDPYETKKTERHFIDGKLSSSIAHLYGLERVAVCAYWGAGWGMTMEENLAWTNANYAYGINLFNQHGGLYTLMGGWYEWVPPDMDSNYQPYWQYFKLFADYVRRLSCVMSQGRHCADVALLYPLSTFHANWIAGRVSGPLTAEQVWPAFTSEAKVASDTTMELAKHIYRNSIDLDFIDYHSLERAQVGEGTLRISDLDFRVLVLPAMTTIRTSTLQKVRDFYASGGSVVAFGRLPGASAERGRGDAKIQALIEEIFGVAPDQPVRETIENKGEHGGRAFFVPVSEAQVPEIVKKAIAVDVVCSETNVYHTHQKINETHIYFLFNAEEHKRVVSISLRAEGQPVIWDSHTGNTERVYRFKREGETTSVRLEMEPYQGIVLVLEPASSQTEVLEDNLTEITSVESVSTGIRIHGFDERGGKKRLRLKRANRDYLLEELVDSPMPVMPVEGPFSFEIQPTMDNRWGDFRYPPSHEFIGAEARTFKYMEEGEQSGLSSGWQVASFDDSQWTEVTYSYGPYWWHIGPFEEGTEPGTMLEKAKHGELSLNQTYESAGKFLKWQPYSFSEKFGYFGNVHSVWGGLLGVSENFFVFTSEGLSKAAHYLSTYVYAPVEQDFILFFGGNREKAGYLASPSLITRLEGSTGFDLPDSRQAWINGEEVLSVDEKQREEISTKIHLKKGWNPILLKLSQRVGVGRDNEFKLGPTGAPMAPGEEGPRTETKIATYAVIRKTATPPVVDPYVPLVRWFADGQHLVCDITPNKEKRVGWYRFKAPPGLAAVRINAKAHRIEAWIDGKPAPIGDNEIRLQSSVRTTSLVALRIEQEPGSYAGAVFTQPVAFECREGQMPLGNWSEFGLSTYSGAGIYQKSANLEKEHLKGKVLLDLGNVRSVAEVHVNGHSAGVRLARPFRFDITNFVKEGENKIQIKVVNTLANHMSTYPTHWINEGQTQSGLLGPVEIRFLSKVNLAATSAAAKND